MAAASLFAKGKTQAEVVRACHVTRQTASRWYAVWEKHGRAGLRAAGRAGRKPRLSARQLVAVEAALRRGPTAHGYATALWTLPFNWKRLALIGALATNPQGRRTRLFFSLHAGTVNSERVTAFLRGLRRHVHGRVVLLWDGLPAHRSRYTAAFLARQKTWLQVERLPAYAPELNPVEYLWAHLTATDLANFTADDLDILARQIRKGTRRVRRHPDLPRAFLKHSGLFS